MASDLELYICDTRVRKSFARQEARSRGSHSGGGEPDKCMWMEMKVGKYWLHEDVVFAHDDLEYTDVRYKYFRKRYSYEVLMGTDGIWVGRISWMKASMDGDVDAYVPDLVQRISELFCGRKLVMINDKLIGLFEKAFAESKQHPHYKTNEREEVIAFLHRNKGKRVFAPNS